MAEAVKEKLKELVIEESQMALPAAEDDFAAQFADMKKKKKKKALPASESRENEGGDMSEAMASSMPEEGTAACAVPMDSHHITTAAEAFISERDAEYAQLLSRIFHVLRQNNPDLAGERKKYSMVPPSIHREGNKKTLFANLTEICKRMNRSPEHVIQYLFTELGTTGSTDGSDRLIIKGRFQQKQIENVLKRYIVEYVTCKTCKSPNTVLRRENRLFFQQCGSCGSTRSVSAIKSGFKAQTEKRAALRNKET